MSTDDKKHPVSSVVNVCARGSLLLALGLCLPLPLLVLNMFVIFVIF